MATKLYSNLHETTVRKQVLDIEKASNHSISSNKLTENETLKAMIKCGQLTDFSLLRRKKRQCQQPHVLSI